MGNDCFPLNSNQLYCNDHLNKRKSWAKLTFMSLRINGQLLRPSKLKESSKRLPKGISFPEREWGFVSKGSARFSQNSSVTKKCHFLTQVQKLRIFQIFDRSNHGYVCWEDFFNSISIFYFGNEKMLATLMFIIFDEKLEKRLSRFELTLLTELNAHYLLDTANDGSDIELEPEEIVENLLSGKDSIGLSDWLNKCYDYFDFNQFRRFFNIFREEKLEKQLVENFNDWN